MVDIDYGTISVNFALHCGEVHVVSQAYSLPIAASLNSQSGPKVSRPVLHSDDSVAKLRT